MVQKVEKDIIHYCLMTRCIYLLLSCVSQLLVPRHDAGVFVSPLMSSVNLTSLPDRFVWFTFNGLSNWDAQHFYQIAQNGYVLEQSLAFFPLYPGVISISTKFLTFFVGESLTLLSKFMLVSYFINLLFFTLSAVVLFRLSRTILRNNLLALQSALLFCVSPSSVFFVASYTETIYSFFVFCGMLKYCRGCVVQSSIFFCLATACRSNGVVNVGFILHCMAYNFIVTLQNKKSHFIKIVIHFVKSLLKTLFCVQLVICPYILFQLFGYHIFCADKTFVEAPSDVVTFASMNGFKLPTDEIVWCNKTIPFPYSYVQSHYWNVGFLKYYTLKQLPNFALALPITLIIVPYSFVFLKRYKSLFFRLKYAYNSNLKLNTKSASSRFVLLPRFTFVFTVHAVFLLAFCLLNINVQVTTRIMCSSSPLVYWIAALHFKTTMNHSNRRNNFKSKAINLGLEPVGKTGSYLWLYFLGYTFIGVVLFSCNYPWT